MKQKIYIFFSGAFKVLIGADVLASTYKDFRKYALSASHLLISRMFVGL